MRCPLSKERRTTGDGWHSNSYFLYAGLLNATSVGDSFTLQGVVDSATEAASIKVSFTTEIEEGRSLYQTTALVYPPFLSNKTAKPIDQSGTSLARGRWSASLPRKKPDNSPISIPLHEIASEASNRRNHSFVGLSHGPTAAMCLTMKRSNSADPAYAFVGSEPINQSVLPVPIGARGCILHHESGKASVVAVDHIGLDSVAMVEIAEAAPNTIVHVKRRTSQ
eukprot:Protomagalhaensia_sp_Gyna_25__4687@NODE_447_length_3404_cov_63_538187_g343_i0_p3_GENE_NODE_447_length_3404_cov_63_538187_g343_i0NODE_447_length_3404_cov_63_538187_g343_i0_p3_ORF_typecomplete_len223_score21_04_NODE_447_length_3404_cov_63_538187_g343_i011381806